MSSTPRSRESPVDGLLAAVRTRIMLRTLLRRGAVGVAIAAVLTTVTLWLDSMVALPPGLRTTLPWLIAAVVILSLLSTIASLRAVTPERLARLVDERSGLGNVLSTYRTPNARGPVAEAFRARAARAIPSVDPARVVRYDAGRLWGWATGATVVAVLSLLATSGSLGPNRLLPDGPEAGRDRGTSEAGDSPLPTLGTVQVTVTPPTYSGLPSEVSTDASTLVVLPGTTVRLAGSGTARGGTLAVRLAGGAVLPTSSSPDGWAAEWVVAPEDRGVSIEAIGPESVVEQRVVPLRLLRDRAPRVSLTDPAEDLVLATASGTLPIRARALDDYGVTELTLHWVHSRGSGESFDFTEGVWSWDEVRPVEVGLEGHVEIALPELDLSPGDVLHVRATARDGNDVTGPGIGASATRQIRISDDDDLADVTTLIGFPIEREREPLLSQRMIILLTEELLDTADVLTSDALMAEARDIADEQARLRGRIGEQIFSRATGAMQDPEAHLDFEEGEAEVFLDELEAAAEQGPVIDPETGIATIANVDIPAHDHDSDPIVAINRSLLQVYNYMWDAERELRSAMLQRSLGPQMLALDMLQELRDSERVFARGRVSVPPIDVAGARGTGELDDATPAPRTPGRAEDPVVAEVVGIIDELLAADTLDVGRPAAVRISGLALDLLEALDDPAPSEALVEAATWARSDDRVELRGALARARTLLRGSAVRASGAVLASPSSLAAARFAPTAIADPSGPAPSRSSTVEPFVFATVRYASGDWDSAPLVPTNLIHSLAQYTELPVEAEGVVVDLSSDDVFDYPFLYLTGHLPVFFDEAESRNLLAFVERGGFVFIDDHNHDIDGAFHRSVTSELARLFGQDRLVPIPNDHELYSAFFEFEDGPPITGHELSGWGDGLIHRELYQVEVDGRIGVLYSNKDYSSEWSYHAENKRFLAIDNTRFGVNILVYALTR